MKELVTRFVHRQLIAKVVLPMFAFVAGLGGFLIFPVLGVVVFGFGLALVAASYAVTRRTQIATQIREDWSDMPSLDPKALAGAEGAAVLREWIVFNWPEIQQIDLNSVVICSLCRNEIPPDAVEATILAEPFDRSINAIAHLDVPLVRQVYPYTLVRSKPRRKKKRRRSFSPFEREFTCPSCQQTLSVDTVLIKTFKGL